MKKRNILLVIILSLLMLLGSMRGNTTTTQDTSNTKLDRLAIFIRYTNPKLHYEESYHIASALITEGKGEFKTLAAIAAVESQYNTKAIGDSGSSLGMFQIQPKHWGNTHYTNIYDHTRLARKILLTVKNVSKYNGSGRKALLYAKKVGTVKKELGTIV